MTAATSPTIAASDFLQVVEEHLPDFAPPTLPGPRLNPREAAAALLSLLAPTPAGAARLCDYRYRVSAGQTMQQMLSDDLLESRASVQLPMRVGPRPDASVSWLISLNEARRLGRLDEQQYLPASTVLTMPFVEAQPAEFPISEVTWPLMLSPELLADLANLFTRESLYAP